MRNPRWHVLLLVALLAAAAPVAAIDPLPFKDGAEETRFRNLTQQLRCLVCQNQTLEDSDADLAKDLRREVFELMRQGKSDAEIKTFLTQRYGDFVLYNPPVQPNTWVLWFGPLLVLGLGAIVLFAVVRRRAGAMSGTTDSGVDDA
jgi:cytochrome c-type biogenesis protein CcmH